METPWPSFVKRLYVETNHGFIELADVTITKSDSERYSYYNCEGTVIAGSETSRLFWATSTHQMTPGVKHTTSLWRRPYCMDQAADSWRGSVVSCG